MCRNNQFESLNRHFRIISVFEKKYISVRHDSKNEAFIFPEMKVAGLKSLIQKIPDGIAISLVLWFGPNYQAARLSQPSFKGNKISATVFQTAKPPETKQRKRVNATNRRKDDHEIPSAIVVSIARLRGWAQAILEHDGKGNDGRRRFTSICFFECFPLFVLF